MTLELTILALSAALGLLQILIATHAVTKQTGFQWNLSARDEKKTITGMAARLERASKNFQETFPLFVAAIAVVHLANRLGPMSTLGAELYLVARVIYVPLYAFGIPVLRTLVWICSVIGIALVLSAAFWS